MQLHNQAHRSVETVRPPSPSPPPSKQTDHGPAVQQHLRCHIFMHQAPTIVSTPTKSCRLECKPTDSARPPLQPTLREALHGPESDLPQSVSSSCDPHQTQTDMNSPSIRRPVGSLMRSISRANSSRRLLCNSPATRGALLWTAASAKQHPSPMSTSTSVQQAAGYSSLTRTGPASRRFAAGARGMATYPDHSVVAMPALSPTMEVGSVAKWNLKVGDSFSPGTAICEVATDKATVTFEATDDGYVAQILVPDAGVEVKVGDPLLVTVEDEADVKAFAAFTLGEAGGAAPAAAPTPAAAAPEPVAAAAPTPAAAAPAAAAPAATGDRVFASPLAKKLLREDFASSGFTLAHLAGKGTGDGGRVTAADVMAFAKTFDATAAAAPAVAAAAPAAAPSAGAGVAAPASAAAPAFVPATGLSGIAVEDFVLPADGNIGAHVAAQYAVSKTTVPHYYLSMEVDMAKVVAMRAAFNGSGSGQLSVLDFVLKAAALAAKTVPDVNASWRDSFVRRYSQVDLNVVMSGAGGGYGTGSDNGVVLPVLRNAGSMGLSDISAAVGAAEEGTAPMGMGTMAVHNLGMFGVKSVAPIILPPQAVALGVGAIVDTVVPNKAAAGGEDQPVWAVTPVMMVTLSCDHRVVDGAVGAQYLQAFKMLLENPQNMLL